MYDEAVDIWNDARELLKTSKESGGLRNSMQVQSRTSAESIHLHMYIHALRKEPTLKVYASCSAVMYACTLCLVSQSLAAHCMLALEADWEAVLTATSNCPCIGHARTEEYVKQNGGEDASFDQFVEPGALILTHMLENNLFPSPERTALIERFKRLNLPKNPLDDLIERLGGADRVAEMTGRDKRMLLQPDGSYRYETRATATASLDDINLEEKYNFQTGKKLVAVISDAASTGISLQVWDERECDIHCTLLVASSMLRVRRRVAASVHSRRQVAGDRRRSRLSAPRIKRA
eukprot:366336-Chlamydomonas_euryale.AAC.18